MNFIQNCIQCCDILGARLVCDIANEVIECIPWMLIDKVSPVCEIVFNFIQFPLFPCLSGPDRGSRENYMILLSREFGSRISSCLRSKTISPPQYYYRETILKWHTTYFSITVQFFWLFSLALQCLECFRCASVV